MANSEPTGDTATPAPATPEKKPETLRDKFERLEREGKIKNVSKTGGGIVIVGVGGVAPPPIVKK